MKYYDVELVDSIPHGTDILDRNCEVMFFYESGSHSAPYSAKIDAWTTHNKVRIQSVYLNILDARFPDTIRYVLTIYLPHQKTIEFDIKNMWKLPDSAGALAPLVKGEGARTELDQVISDLPWNDEWIYGAGVDAVTGKASGPAVKSFEPPHAKVGKATESFRLIESKTELVQEIETAVSGKYNIQGVTVDGSASFLGKLEFSQTSVALLATYEVESDGYDEMLSYELTDEARKLIAEPQKFRKVYGDYFVSGARRGSRFVAVYQCKSSSAKSLAEFKVSLGGSTPDVFSAEGSLRLKEAASQSQVAVSVYVYMEGYSGKPPAYERTPEGIIKLFDWFKQNEEGLKLRGKLRHYSTIDPSFPRQIEVSPAAFVELRSLYTNAWEIRGLYGACPTTYQADLSDEYHDLENGIVANQGELATDGEKRGSLLESAFGLSAKLDAIFDRMNFYHEVADTVASEPGKDTPIWSTEGGQRTWKYGYDSFHKDAVIIHNETRNHHSVYQFWNPTQKHAFEFGPDGKRLIVGWEVRANWPSHDGFWKKMLGQILLKDHAVINIESEFARGYNWTTTIYYVDAKDYQFK